MIEISLLLKRGGSNQCGGGGNQGRSSSAEGGLPGEVGEMSSAMQVPSGVSLGRQGGHYSPLVGGGGGLLRTTVLRNQ